MSRHTTLIVTIDGPAGVGKSTLAKRLAAALGVAYLDTGAMFRALAMRLAEKGWRPGPDAGKADDDPQLQKLLADCTFALRGTGAETELLFCAKPVGEDIRSEEAGMMAANIAVVPQIRNYLKAAQQSLGAAFSLVAEGRDMGTAVFPTAAHKIFLDADPEIRAKRRCLQLKEMGQDCDLAALTEQIRQRDDQDRNRAAAPLRPAADAVIVDTSRLNIEEVFAAIIKIAGPKDQAPPPDRPIRRKDRSITREECLALLKRCEYGMMAVTDKDGWPYAVPLSYALMDDALYFHCAFSGHKVDCLNADSRVCFTVVGETQPVYITDYSTYYESVVVRGRATLVGDVEEKTRALWALSEKYLPEHMDKFEENINHSFSRTAVYKITLEQVTGKAKRAKAK